MTRRQAESFPEVTSLPRILAHESSANTTLHTIACMFSPRIEYVETHPGTYALDIQGMNTLYGDGAQLASKLRQRIIAAGFLANVERFVGSAYIENGDTPISVFVLALVFALSSPIWAAPKSVTLAVPGMTCPTCPVTSRRH
jgi:protein ImuB